MWLGVEWTWDNIMIVAGCGVVGMLVAFVYDIFFVFSLIDSMHEWGWLSTNLPFVESFENNFFLIDSSKISIFVGIWLFLFVYNHFLNVFYVDFYLFFLYVYWFFLLNIKLKKNNGDSS